MIDTSNIYTDLSNKYLIAGQLSTGNSQKISGESDKKSTPEVLNRNLQEAHNFYNRDGTNFSQITSEKEITGNKNIDKRESDNNAATSDLSLSSSATAGTLPSPQAQALKIINIIYTNDLHGCIAPKENAKNPGSSSTGGMAYTATVIREQKKKSEGNAILLDGGDWAQGSYESGITKGKTMIDVMNSLDYDAAEVGNHEFDWSQEDLEGMAERAKFPVLGANLEKEKEGVLDKVKPYTIKEVNGVKIGILGIVTPDVSELTKPQNMEGLKVHDPKETAEKYVKELREKGVDMVVVLSHEGEEEDKKLAQSVKGIDVIVGGHSHTAIEKPDVVNGTLIVQSGSKGDFVGNLQLNIDPVSKKIVSSENRLLPVNTEEVKPDPEVEKIIAPVIEEGKKKKAEVIGNTLVDLNHRTRVTESTMGDIITDAMREKAGSDIAMLNSGGIRGEIKKGDITYEGIYKILPFDNKLATKELTGKQIKEILEKTPWTEKNDLQVSGLTMDIDSSKQEGEKVSNIKIGGKTLEMDKIYRVTADDFLSNGGANYDLFKEGKNLEHGPMVVDTVREYIKEHSPFNEESRETGKRINYR